MLISIGIIITAVIATILILVQERSSGTGGAFGGGDAGGFYQQRRGVERMLFVLTVVAITGFIIFSLLNLTDLGGKTTIIPNNETPVVPQEGESPAGTVEEGAPAPSPEDAPVQ